MQTKANSLMSKFYAFHFCTGISSNWIETSNLETVLGLKAFDSCPTTSYLQFEAAAKVKKAKLDDNSSKASAHMHSSVPENIKRSGAPHYTFFSIS